VEITDPGEIEYWKASKYEELFDRVESILYSIVNKSPDIDLQLEQIKTNFISTTFIFPDEKIPPTISLPNEVITWVEQERILQKDKKERNNARSKLIDTFLLLIVLGAFGSLIFLTRDYISKDTDTAIAAYIFRPVLGMFLAMAMFVIDILAHSVISTSGMLSIRPEPLFLLAFAAGLLSEQAYEIVLIRAQTALQRIKEKQKVDTRTKE